MPMDNFIYIYIYQREYFNVVDNKYFQNKYFATNGEAEMQG